MLNYALLTVIYVLISTFHNVLFFIFFAGLIRIFVIKYSAYAQTFVGFYLMCHSIYGGCPIIEIENFLARQIDVQTEVVGDLYMVFGDYGQLLRVVFFVLSLMIVYSAHKTFHKVTPKLNWNNLKTLSLSLDIK